MDRLLALAAAIAASGLACASETKAFKAELVPGAEHEECMHLDKGDKRNYSWKSDAPVDFNIHYHEKGDAAYPVKRDGMRGDGGTFEAKVAQDYCWMWSARDKKARLEGKIQ